jgi:pimeloyl-ACP methyl ester carboxylesterase
VVISGAHDRTPSPSTARERAVGPRRRFNLVEDCAHYVSLERPERFRSLLARTLAELDREPTT